MTTRLVILLALLTSVYLVLLLWLCFGLRRLYRQRPNELFKKPPGDRPGVSLIVCAKNEERRLPRLLRALEQQQYPRDRLEICLVDDRSSDRTGKIIDDFAAAHFNVIALRINDTAPNFAPKKRAIDAAIRRTTGEIILLTDADSTPGPRWIQEMAAAFAPKVVMVCGYSPYVPRDSMWQKILALEYFSHAAVAAGGCGAGRPLTCTGSNLAYRREAYLRLGGFEGIAQWISGDDDLLLHKMHDANIGEIVYLAHPAAHAPVQPPASWREFKSQRTRYASKSLHYQPALTLALGAVFLLNLLIIAGWLSVAFGVWNFFFPTIIISLLKAGGDFFYLRQAAKLFDERRLFSAFPLAALLHPFYVVYFAVRGQFAKFSWRGEQFAAKKRSTDFFPRIEEAHR
ncbi:MAG: glycosyltransferase [candidate division KSB1 bacterium]|nr:glycosyltransferase [candidate division KSB1 bacterium]MDZ7366008.1 glycosyltransferase [candidate division KSB1 bacterium]MDZ7404125.1 glycosyltransferase [candidate division KSB1 bacterium]